MVVDVVGVIHVDLSNKIGGDSMIEFDKGKYTRFSDIPETWEQDKKTYSDRISALVKDLCKNKIELGCRLIEFFGSKLYVKNVYTKHSYDGINRDLVPCGLSGEVSHHIFFDHCESTFGLDKSQVSRYMNVADEFADKENGCLAEKWQDFGYSQLVEMLSLTPEQRENITSDMTVKAIREYKNSLVATSQQDKPSKKSVATSQQEDTESEEETADSAFERKAILFKISNDPKYERFYGFTAKRLCDIYIDLEQKYCDLKAENEQLKAGGTT